MKAIVHIFLLIVSISIFTSCSRNDVNQAEATPETFIETPEVMLKRESGKSDLIYSSFKRSKDMVDELFKEACQTDSALNKLKNSIQDEINASTEKIDEFLKYRNVIANVWSSNSNHISFIDNDSLLVKDLSELNVLSEKEFMAKIKPYLTEIDNITVNKERLENKLEELKIKIAIKMMKRYQDNEIPDLKNLKDKNENLEQLLIEIKKEIKEV